MAARVLDVAFPEKVIEMWRKGSGCDTTIICEGDIALKAHSLVLCSVSNTLDDWLNSNQNKIIHTPFVKAEVWRVLLETVYTGSFQSENHFEQINDVLYVAKSFAMNDLLQGLEAFKNGTIKSCKEITPPECTLDISTFDHSSKSFGITEYISSSLRTSKEDQSAQNAADNICHENNRINDNDKSGSGTRTGKKRGRPPKKSNNLLKAADVGHHENNGVSGNKTNSSSSGKKRGRPPKNQIFEQQKSNSIELGEKMVHKERHRRPKEVKCKRCDHAFESYYALMKHTCGENPASSVSKHSSNTSNTLLFVDIIKTEMEDPETERNNSLEMNTEVTDIVEKPIKSPGSNSKINTSLSGKKWLKKKGLLHDFEKSSERENKGAEKIESPIKRQKFHANQDRALEENMEDEFGSEKSEIIKERKCLCSKCGKDCHSLNVRCALCFLVVKRDVQHMDECHPYTPKENAWVFRCNFTEEKTNKVDSKQIVLSVKVPRKCGSSKEHKVIDEGWYKCLKCKKQFGHLNDIKKHFIVRHQTVLKTCTVCESGFQYTYYLRDHQHFCEGGKLYECEVCGETLGCLNAWTSHVEKHSGNLSKSSPVKNMNELQISHRTVQMKDEEAVVIPRKSFCLQCRGKCVAEKVICLYCFKVVNRLSSHMEKQHPFSPITNMWIYSCKENLLDGHVKWFSKDGVCKYSSICSKIQLHTSEPDAQDKVMLLGEGSDQQETKMYACQTCSHSFTSFVSLANHISQRFLCHICNDMFDTQKVLEDHFTLEHSDVSFNACQTCGMGFVDQTQKSCHEYYCAGGNIVHCRECDLVFATPEQLKSHEEDVPHKTTSSVLNIEAAEDIDGNLVEIQEATDSPTPLGVIPSPVHPISSAGSESINIPDEVSKIPADVAHKKVCLVCGPGCEADIVQCGYCAERVTVISKTSHFNEFHPCIPNTSLWPVYCRKARLRRGTTENVLAKQITAVSDQSTSVSHDSPKKVVGYTCLKCEERFGTSEAIVDHIKEKHSIDAVSCGRCGMLQYSQHHMLLAEHQYFCWGGTLYQCSYCQRVSGSEKTAALHRRGIHKTYNMAEPWSIKKGWVPVNTTVGQNNYFILCVGCKGKCEQGEHVMCGLCRAMVEKDDIHMKTKHAATPSKNWVVNCNFKMMEASKSPKVFMGQELSNLPEPFKYKCLECTICFEDESSLKEHIADEHAGKVFINKGPVNKLFSSKCKYCKMVLMCTKNDYLVDHVQFCGTGNLHLCNMCGMEFASYENLRDHQNEKDCGLNQLKRKKAWEKGDHFVAIPQGFVLQCAECDFNTTILSKLKDHNKFKHGYTRYEVNQICQVCFKVFRKRSQREKHELQEHLEKNILCDLCGDSFHTKTQFTSHWRYHHGGKRLEMCERQKLKRAITAPQSCTHCDKQFKSPYLLNQHIRIHHEKTLDITCHFCGKSFLTKHRLLTHLNRHNGIKPYACTVCPFKDYTGALVNKHMRKQHPGVEIAYKRTFVTKTEESESQEDYMILPNPTNPRSVIDEALYLSHMQPELPPQIPHVQQNILIDPQQMGVTSNSDRMEDLVANDPNIIVDENSADPHVILDENMYKYIVFQ